MQREPSYYQLIVESHMEKKRICEGEEVSVTHLPDGTTRLEGLMDRAALSGILQRIGNLGLTLVSVQRKETIGGNDGE